MNEKLYYLQDSRGLLGSRIMFWGKNGSGYTSNINAAHVYSESEARSMNNNRETDIPLLKSAIDQMAYKTVDHQYIKEETKTPTGEGYFYLIMDGEFDGNDVRFYPGTYRLDDAKDFNAKEAKQKIIDFNRALKAIPKTHAATISRMAVEHSSALMKAAKMKNLRKIYKPREIINCYHCGKFFNPEKIQSLTCPHCDNSNYP